MRRMLHVPIVALLWATVAGSAGADMTAIPANGNTGVCSMAPCRSGPTRIQLRTDEGVYDLRLDPAPYLNNGAITIFPGEALIFRFDETSDHPAALHFVRVMAGDPVVNVPPSDSSFQSDSTTKVQHDPKSGENVYTMKAGSIFAPERTAEDHLRDQPPGTLMISYGQAEGRPDMVLRIEHNLPRALKFDVFIDRVTSDGGVGLERTSTCPVQPLLADMESWPYPIGTITLQNFRFIETKDGFNCE